MDNFAVDLLGTTVSICTFFDQKTETQDLFFPSPHQMPVIWVFTCQWGMLSLVIGPYYGPCNRRFYNNLQVFSSFMKISAKPFN